jgi:arsenite-transporting ATPase
LESLRALVTDPSVSSVQLVLTPERVVAAETRRSITALALQGIRVDRLLVNRLVPAVGARARGPAAEWVRTRRREQDAVVSALQTDLPGVPVTTIEHRAAEPVGLAALREFAAELSDGDEEGVPFDLGPGVQLPPLLTVAHAGGSGLDAEYTLRLSLPFLEAETVDLSRVDNDLAVTVSGHRRLVTLPSALRRCTVTGAEVDAEGILVRFRPDPSVWMR